MSIYEDIPDFRDVPANLANKTNWLFFAYVDMKRELDGLRAQLAVSVAEAAGACDRVPVTTVGNGPKPTRMRDYPAFKPNDRIKTLEGHFQTIGGEPSKALCLERLSFFVGKPKDNDKFAKFYRISKDEAIAWTYILKKRGWIIWDESKKGLVLSKECNRPGLDVPES